MPSPVSRDEHGSASTVKSGLTRIVKLMSRTAMPGTHPSASAGTSAKCKGRWHTV